MRRSVTKRVQPQNQDQPAAENRPSDEDALNTKTCKCIHNVNARTRPFQAQAHARKVRPRRSQGAAWLPHHPNLNAQRLFPAGIVRPLSVKHASLSPVVTPMRPCRWPTPQNLLGAKMKSQRRSLIQEAHVDGTKHHRERRTPAAGTVGLRAQWRRVPKKPTTPSAHEEARPHVAILRPILERL